MYMYMHICASNHTGDTYSIWNCLTDWSHFILRCYITSLDKHSQFCPFPEAFIQTIPYKRIFNTSNLKYKNNYITYFVFHFKHIKNRAQRNGSMAKYSPCKSWDLLPTPVCIQVALFPIQLRVCGLGKNREWLKAWDHAPT